MKFYINGFFSLSIFSFSLKMIQLSKGWYLSLGFQGLSSLKIELFEERIFAIQIY